MTMNNISVESIQSRADLLLAPAINYFDNESADQLKILKRVKGIIGFDILERRQRFLAENPNYSEAFKNGQYVTVGDLVQMQVSTALIAIKGLHGSARSIFGKVIKELELGGDILPNNWYETAKEYAKAPAPEYMADETVALRRRQFAAAQQQGQQL